MRLKSHSTLLILATAAMLAGSAAPALADDPPPADPPICFNPDGTPTHNEGCPPDEERQATGH